MSQSAAALTKRSSMTGTDIQQLLLKARAFIVLILVTIIFAVIAPNFLAVANMEIMAKHVAINAILGIGMTFVILTGGIDLSVGSIVGLTAMVAGMMINDGLKLPMFGVIVYPSTWLIMVIALAVGTFMGAVNGFIITRFDTGEDFTDEFRFQPVVFVKIAFGRAGVVGAVERRRHPGRRRPVRRDEGPDRRD